MEWFGAVAYGLLLPNNRFACTCTCTCASVSWRCAAVRSRGRACALGLGMLDKTGKVVSNEPGNRFACTCNAVVPHGRGCAAGRPNPSVRHRAPVVRQGKDYGKPRMTYKDYTMTESGLQYQVRVDGGGVTGGGWAVETGARAQLHTLHSHRRATCLRRLAALCLPTLLACTCLRLIMPTSRTAFATRCTGAGAAWRASDCANDAGVRRAVLSCISSVSPFVTKAGQYGSPCCPCQFRARASSAGCQPG